MINRNDRYYLLINYLVVKKKHVSKKFLFQMAHALNIIENDDWLEIANTTAFIYLYVCISTFTLFL